LVKQSRLTPEERKRIQEHRKYGATLPHNRQYRSLQGQRFFDFDLAPNVSSIVGTDNKTPKEPVNE
jgi:hypothetical protein